MPARSGIEVVITALTRNQVYRQRYRGFESHPLRQLRNAPYSTNPRLAARIDARRGVSSFQNRNRLCGLRFCFLNLRDGSFWTLDSKGLSSFKPAIADAGLQVCFFLKLPLTARIPALRRGSMPDGAFLRFKIATACADCDFVFGFKRAYKKTARSDGS